MNHERHEFFWIPTNVEELESILLYSLLEDRMCGNADSVTMFVVQNKAKSNERLDITPRSNDLDNNIQSRWSRLADN